MLAVRKEQAMWRAVGWVCALVGVSCNALPDVAVIQTAYEREASAGSKLHDKDLQVLESKCHDDGNDRWLCEVTFVSRSDASQRLFFDIVAVARAADGWELKSGLCKR
jgi:hypothetical protein